VRSFGFDGLAIGAEQHRRHQAERAEALRHGVRLHIAVVVLARPHELARPLQCRGNHVVDQAVFVDHPLGLELFGEAFGVEHFLKQILEAAIIGFQDGVLGRQIHRPTKVEAVIEAGAGEIADRIVKIVHRHRHAGAGEIEYVEVDFGAIIAVKHQPQLAGAGDQRVGGLVLIAERMAANHDRVSPAGYQTRHIVDHDWFAEHHAAQNIADRAVG